MGIVENFYRSMAGSAGAADSSGFSVQQARQVIQDAYTPSALSDRMNKQMLGQGWKTPKAGRSALSNMSSMGREAFWQGGASAVWGVEPTPFDMDFVEKAKAGSALKKYGSLIPKGVRNAAGAVGKAVSKWAGPAITAYRLYDETPDAYKKGGVLGAADKTARIVTDEYLTTAGFFTGMSMGAAIGSAALPVAGTIIGGFIGGMIGSAIGGWASSAVGFGLDVAESPIRFAGALKQLGKTATRVELGGQISRGNSTKAAFTMRQRALQSMSRSGMNARSLLGNEASMMHLRSMT